MRINSVGFGDWANFFGDGSDSGTKIESAMPENILFWKSWMQSPIGRTGNIDHNNELPVTINVQSQSLMSSQDYSTTWVGRGDVIESGNTSIYTRRLKSHGYLLSYFHIQKLTQDPKPSSYDEKYYCYFFKKLF